MKLQKRSEGASDAAPAEETPSTGHKNKPVIVYIMILFIVAFLLMALSFVMHQRSNEEVIGTLQSSVSTLKELQESQDRNMQLQDELDETARQIETLEKQLDELESARQSADERTHALLELYTLQQQYAGRELDACRQTIQTMEDEGLSALLSRDAIGQVISPAERYQELKEAVMSAK